MSVCDVREYGASGDGSTNDTISIQRAIDHCAQEGGGTVLLENGQYISGTLRLRSNVTLKIKGNARLLASRDIRDYLEDVHHNRYRNEQALDRCLIYAEDAENVGIVSTGP